MITQQRDLTRTAAPARPATQPRRLTAATVDALIALMCGLAAAGATGVTAADGVVELHVQSPTVWAAALGALLGSSFLNHVLLTRATRASLGKLTTGLRVVRASDGGSPRLLPLVGRWLFGFYWTVLFVPLHLATDSGVEQQDAVGIRVVRRS